MVSELNGLDIFCAGVQNTYLNSNIKDQAWFVAGDNFASTGGTVVIIFALYSLKVVVSSWE